MPFKSTIIAKIAKIQVILSLSEYWSINLFGERLVEITICFLVNILVLIIWNSFFEHKDLSHLFYEELVYDNNIFAYLSCKKTFEEIPEHIKSSVSFDIH